MEVTIGEMLTAADKVKKVLHRDDFPGRISTKLSRLVRLLDPELMDVQEAERKIQDKHIKRDENGNAVLAKDEEGNVIPGQYVLEDPEAYVKEMQELLDSKVEIPFIPFVDSDFEHIRISPEIIIGLGPFVQEG